LIRRATADDAEAVARLVERGLATYRSFAPEGWEPPPQHAARYRERIARPGNVGFVAEVGGRVVGHVAFDPSEHSGLAHLWNLYLDEEHWGTGLAVELHARAVEAALNAGFAEMRLYVPAGQARARRFYEREGWRFASAEVTAFDIGIELIEMRRPIGG
jgi:GNAT superfamily N-acetyltransferase